MLPTALAWRVVYGVAARACGLPSVRYRLPCGVYGVTGCLARVPSSIGGVDCPIMRPSRARGADCRMIGLCAV